MPWRILFSPSCPDDDESIEALVDEWIALAVAGHIPAIRRLIRSQDGKLGRAKPPPKTV